MVIECCKLVLTFLFFNLDLQIMESSTEQLADFLSMVLTTCAAYVQNCVCESSYVLSYFFYS